jgi:hypothetical protein
VISKIKVFASILDRSSFTIADLAEQLSLPGPTVRSVIDRLPSGWLTAQKLPTGKRGGSPVVYSVSEEGRLGIRQQLGELPVPATVFRPTEVPLGLSVAEDLLASARNAEPPRCARLLDRARTNLEWAAAEIRSTQGDARAELVARLNRAEDALAQRRDELANAQQLASLVAVETSAGPSPVLVVSTIGDDQAAMKLAESTETSLRSLLHLRDMIAEQPGESRASIRKWAMDWRDFERLIVPSPGQASLLTDADVHVFCFDSSKHGEDIDRIFNRVRGLRYHTPVDYILDIADNSCLRRLAREQHAFHYASDVDNGVDWMDRNVLSLCGLVRRTG